MTREDLTGPQRTALDALRGKQFMTPQEIGYAMTTQRKWPLVPQGAGRLGGTMAARLAKMGLVEDASRLHRGFAAYRLTGSGYKLSVLPSKEG